MFATAGLAVLVSIVSMGIRQENSMGWGMVISIALLPVLFLVYGITVTLAKLFCNLGNSLLGPLPSSTWAVSAAWQASEKIDQYPDSDVSVTDSTNVTDETETTEVTEVTDEA